MKNLLLFFTAIILLSSCAKDDDNDGVQEEKHQGPTDPTEPRGPFDRTVLVYISGENNLNDQIAPEMKEIRQGSKGIGNNALVVYVDDADTIRKPYILYIREGETVDSMSFENDYYSSSPQVMSRVLNHVSTYYPANEYGLVLWGHASGWLIADSVTTDVPATARRRAYGVDNGRNIISNKGKWMNMATLAKTLESWKKLKFIMADCCQFQCVESVFELRKSAEYIIGSPAEIPAAGAPYNTMIPALFGTTDKFYETIVDRYFEQTVEWSFGGGRNNLKVHTPLSVVYTPMLEKLATETNVVLRNFVQESEKSSVMSPLSGLIYYGGTSSYARQNDVFYDMNDFIRRYTCGKTGSTFADSVAYNTWKDVFDQTVIYKKYGENGWATNGQVNYNSFEYLQTEGRYGGMSMFVPQERLNSHYVAYVENGVSYKGYNEEIKSTSWYGFARLSDFGW